MRQVRFEAEETVHEGILEGDEIVTDSGSYHTDDVDFLPPCDPTKIIAMGKNYAKHIEEMNERGKNDGKIPEVPFLFFKPASSVIGHGDSIVYPESSNDVEFEGELAVVIGETCKDVAKEDAFDYVAGYTCANDVSARDWSDKEHQWIRSKGMDTFCPIGPCLQTEWKDSLAIETRVNGETKQSSNTELLIVTVPHLIEEITRFITLEEGDVILTGTPDGVGPLTPGDTVEVEIEGAGTLSNDVV